MVLNDIITKGAEPLFFLDYIALAPLDSQRIKSLVRGIAQSCKDTNCALIGGETAEMTGFHKHGYFDIAGFAVGCVERTDYLTAENTQVGDVLIALPSTGIHANGFSLVRQIIKDERIDMQSPAPNACLLYTSPSPRDRTRSRMPSSA